MNRTHSPVRRLLALAPGNPVQASHSATVPVMVWDRGAVAMIAPPGQDRAPDRSTASVMRPFYPRRGRVLSWPG